MRFNGRNWAMELDIKTDWNMDLGTFINWSKLLEIGTWSWRLGHGLKM